MKKNYRAANSFTAAEVEMMMKLLELAPSSLRKNMDYVRLYNKFRSMLSRIENKTRLDLQVRAMGESGESL